MGFFSNINNSSKSIELEKLMNETMKATYEWELNNNHQTIINAANSIRNNTPRIIKLYSELVKANKSKNLYITNKSIPPPMPKEFSVQMGIMGIFDMCEAIGNANPSFKNQLVNEEVIGEFEEIIYFM